MRYKKIKLDEMNVDLEYQRDLKKILMNEIIKDFFEEAVGVLTVGERTDGSLWLADGQCRKGVLKKLGRKVAMCQVFSSRGKKHEADIFCRLNRRTQMSMLDKLRANLCRGEKETVALVKCVRDNGFDVGINSPAWPNIRAVLPLQRSFRAGNLAATLKLVDAAWGPSEDSVSIQGPMIWGISLFLTVYGELIDLPELAKRLSRYTCSALIGRCDSRKMQGGGRGSAMRNVIIEVWNVGRKSRKTKLQIIQ